MVALSHLKSSLTDLTIFRWKIPGRRGGELSSYSIGSFAEFEKLTSIDTEASILLGDSTAKLSHDLVGGFRRRQKLIDAVPKTLECLTIRRCNEDKTVVPHLFEVISQKASYSPNLRYVNLIWLGDEYTSKRYHGGFNKIEAENLLAECKTAKVKIEFHNIRKDH